MTTLSDVADAIERNGLRQNFNGDYFVYDLEEDSSGNPVAACAIGMASINLNLAIGDVENVLIASGIKPYRIANLNDKGHTFKWIADWIREQAGINIP